MVLNRTQQGKVYWSRVHLGYSALRKMGMAPDGNVRALFLPDIAVSSAIKAGISQAGYKKIETL